MEIKGLVALVSGGASGLGEATSRYLVEKGARVSVCDVVEEKGRLLAAELGDSALFCRTDVTDEESLKAAVRSTALQPVCANQSGGNHECHPFNGRANG
jgi:NAD(P)-dependent dehydrogenase (short-subunit alcohol dehydrogenase family)